MSDNLEATAPAAIPAAIPTGPLAGVKVAELGGIGPVPFCGMLLGDLGAEVVRIDRPAAAGRPSPFPVLHRNRRSLAVDLKQPQGVDTVLRLVEDCDAVLEGFRPGTLERLGLGPDDCLARNPRLVYGRMTGWGQTGPLALQPGHDINYIALAGALHTIGPADGDPVPPLNLVGDFGGGGMLLALGVLGGVLSARTTGRGQVVDTAMTDGTALQLAMVYGFLAQGRWEDRRGSNMLDGGAPYYGVYRCADGGHVAVGAIEGPFYAALLQVLDLTDDPDFARQQDRAAWPVMRRRLEQVFAGRPRDEWARVFEGRGACVTAVLSLAEAAEDPHNTARGTYRTGPGDVPEPAPAPRFSATPAPEPAAAVPVGADTDRVLAGLGLAAEEIAALREKGVVG